MFPWTKRGGSQSASMRNCCQKVQAPRGHRVFNLTVSGGGDAPVGGLWLWGDADNRQGFIHNITVLPEHRCRGFLRCRASRWRRT